MRPLSTHEAVAASRRCCGGSQPSATFRNSKHTGEVVNILYDVSARKEGASADSQHKARLLTFVRNDNDAVISNEGRNLLCQEPLSFPEFLETVANRQTNWLLCHCEERSDEAISW